MAADGPHFLPDTPRTRSPLPPPLERHLGWRGAVPAYVIASYVAASRLHENRHFASDVVFGSAVGIIAGRTVTRHGRDYFAAGLQPVPGGMALLFVRRND